MDNQVFKVTRDWLHKHKTKRGGFTKAQILALGLDYPLESGWMDSVVGELITKEQSRSFEDGKDKFSSAKSMKAAKIVSSLKALSNSDLLLIEREVKQLLNK